MATKKPKEPNMELPIAGEWAGDAQGIELLDKIQQVLMGEAIPHVRRIEVVMNALGMLIGDFQDEAIRLRFIEAARRNVPIVVAHRVSQHENRLRALGASEETPQEQQLPGLPGSRRSNGQE